MRRGGRQRSQRAAPTALLAIASWGWGCSEGPAPSSAAIEIAEPSALGRPDDGHVTHADVAFGGVVVRRTVVRPGELVAGRPAVLQLEVEAPTGGSWPAELVIGPPRPASRQVALGGVGAPPATVPDDPRMQRIPITLHAGLVTVDLPPLPTPWHPRRAAITLSMPTDPATSGPRRADGAGVLALVPVATVPTDVAARRVATPPTIDGRLDEWTSPPYPLVTSLDGEPWEGPPTGVWWAWDETALYVAADIADPDVWSEYTAQDDPLWKQEVFEVFVFADDDGAGYLELQVSPRGVTFDARFPTYRRGDEAWDSTWTTAVVVDGTLDERRDVDRGWTAEVAIPWSEICEHTSATCPPQPGQMLRVNAFRFERPAEGPTVALALSPTRVPDFHAAKNAAMLTLAGR